MNDSRDSVTSRLYATTDARVWAHEWCEIAREVEARGDSLIDEDWMIGWFANAIENAKDHLRREVGLVDSGDAYSWTSNA